MHLCHTFPTQAPWISGPIRTEAQTQDGQAPMCERLPGGTGVPALQAVCGGVRAPRPSTPLGPSCHHRGSSGGSPGGPRTALSLNKPSDTTGQVQQSGASLPRPCFTVCAGLSFCF